MPDLPEMCGSRLYRVGEEGLDGLTEAWPKERGWTAAELRLAREDAYAALGRCIEALRADDRGLLVVLQGMDAAGKDGVFQDLSTIPALATAARMVRFRRPDAEEMRHDFLWRIHKAAPARGEVVFFNRSHYEDVIIPRVEELEEPAITAARCAHIVAFERLLSDENITVVKFFLHVTREVQRQRLLDRVTREDGLHNPDDLRRARHWERYMRAYEAAIRATSADHAPWYVVPADDRRARNVLVAAALVRELSAS